MRLLLPIFHEGTHLITASLGYNYKGGMITYVQGMMPVFSHHVANDTASIRMIISQFNVNGNAKQGDLVKAFGIRPQALKRWVKRFREGGAIAFYIEKRLRPRLKKRGSGLKAEPDEKTGSQP